MTENDLQMLEIWLDGELPPAEAQDLQARLAGDAPLAAGVAELRQQRELLAGIYAAMEPDEAAIDRVNRRIRTSLEQRRRFAWRMHIVRTAGAIAACAAIGFGVGWIGRGGMNMSATPAAAPHKYQVNIADESGQIIGTQHFSSPDQAREFSEDLKRWQEQQDQIRSGHVVVRSARF